MASEMIASEPAMLDFLIVALRGEPLDISSEFPWNALYRVASSHRVLSLLHEALSRQSDHIPPFVLADLSGARRYTQKQSLLGLHQRDEILQLFSTRHMPVLVVKGAAWARPWYQDVSLRPFHDIDLLVPTSQLAPCRQILLEAGYRDSERAVNAPQHETPLVRPDRPCSIELHRHLLLLPAREQLTYEQVEARTLMLDGVRTLDVVDTLVHISMHLLHHIHIEGGWRLLQAWDIAQHVKTGRVVWDLFEKRAQEIRFFTACCSVLGLTALLTNIEIPDRYRDDDQAKYLLRFPMDRFAAFQIPHRRILSLLDALSRRDIRRTIALLIHAISPQARTKGRSEDVMELRDMVARDVAPGLTLSAVPAELAWLIAQACRPGRGSLRDGIGQIRMEAKARKVEIEVASGSRITEESQTKPIVDGEQ